MISTVLLVQLFSTLAMVGIIWFVQLVHYPLFSEVSVSRFSAYEAAHTRRTTLVVAPLMVAEAATAFLLALLAPPAINATAAYWGAALVAVLWLSTFAAQVPAHTRLSSGFDAGVHRYLVWSNWLRTALWTVRGVLVCSMSAPMLRAAAGE